MKRLALILTLTALSAPALAGFAPADLFQGLPFDVKLRATSPASTRIGGDDPVSQPIRTAKFKARIIKSTVRVEPDGSMSFDDQDVCVRSGNLNVYDSRGKGSLQVDIGDFKVAGCPSTLKGAPVTMWIGGLLDHHDTFLVDSTASMKAAVGVLLTEDATNAITSWESSYAVTRDPKTSSFVLFPRPSLAMRCEAEDGNTRCEINIDEFHSAIIEVED